MRCKSLLGLGSMLLAFAWGVSSGAATTTATFQVNANVEAACTINATDMNFGDYVGIKVSAQSQITFQCNPSTQWNIGLNEGTCPGATVTTRCMTGPGSFRLNYQLATSGTGAIIWGNTVGVDTVSGEALGGTALRTVYGTLFANQAVGAGGYADTITATITF